MAQPPAYTPQTEFLTYQAQQAWFPGQNLDVEFNAIQASITAIERNLLLIQQDDGALLAGSVGLTQLDPAVLAILGVAPGTVPSVWGTPQTFQAGLIVQNFPSIGVSPTGNPTTGSILTTFAALTAQGTANSNTNREFYVNLGLVSSAGSGVPAGNGNDGKVTLYSGISGQAGSGSIWALNTVTSVESTFPANRYAQGYELDFNNFRQDYPPGANPLGLPAPFAVGMNVSGDPVGTGVFRSSAAYAVAGGGWFLGYAVFGDVGGANSAAFYEFTNPGSTYGILLNGAHTYGVYVSANSTQSIHNDPVGINLQANTRLASALDVRSGADARVIYRGQLGLVSGTSIYSVNDLNNNTVGLEFGASTYLFTTGVGGNAIFTNPIGVNLGAHPIIASTALDIRAGADQRAILRGPVTLGTGVSLYSINDANNATEGLEFGATSFLFTGGPVTLTAAQPLSWSARAQMQSPADGIIELLNNAGTGFTRLQLGGTTASFPAIKRNSTALNFRLADDSGDAAITSGNVNSSGVYQVAGTQVVGARATGWTVATGTPQRTTFTTGGVTLAQLAGVVMALEQDLIAHGLIGT